MFPTNSLVIPLQEKGSKIPLILIHGVDGEVERFRTLVPLLEPDRPVFAIRAQGLIKPASALTRIEDLAALYRKEIQCTLSDVPIHLLGFSFGGYLAYEIGRLNRRHGAAHTGMVGLLDTQPMGARSAGHIAGDESSSPKKPETSYQRHWRSLRRRNALAYLTEKVRARSLRHLYQVFGRLDRPIPRVLQSAYDLNWFAAARYHPSVIAGPLVLFQCVTDGACDQAAIESWRSLAQDGVEVRTIEGNHTNLLEEPYVRVLAEAVTKCLT